MSRKQEKELFPSGVNREKAREIQVVAFELGHKDRLSICLVWNFEMMELISIRRSKKVL